ncbi:hypothetical protein OE88DRAFT_852594 [Heliocybe sulcata]|uniref:Uncharacterized protein n=1 Tax=Heliocybe sulcata TaxID=5364 RepID=A0A5C3MRN0_9AGAM|nr:hypothetical protein OE88DRAFT_852594 [Heliocybe sulcata]
MASIHLPNEILQTIFLLACRDSGQTSCSIRGACRLFREAMERYRFRCVALSSYKQITLFYDTFTAQSTSDTARVSVRHLFLINNTNYPRNSMGELLFATSSLLTDRQCAVESIVSSVSATLETFYCIIVSSNRLTVASCPLSKTILTTHFPRLTHLTFHLRAFITSSLTLADLPPDMAMEEAPFMTFPALTHLHLSFKCQAPLQAAHVRLQTFIRRASASLRHVHISGIVYNRHNGIPLGAGVDLLPLQSGFRLPSITPPNELLTLVESEGLADIIAKDGLPVMMPFSELAVIERFVERFEQQYDRLDLLLLRPFTAGSDEYWRDDWLAFLAFL